MSKYRGKHNGKTRGKYQLRLLLHETNDWATHNNLDNQINNYLFDKGQIASRGLRDDADIAWTEYAFSNIFHLGGATIGFESYWYEEPKWDTKGRIELHLVSNDSLDDVIQKITERFPVFKEQKVKYSDF